MTLSQKKKNFLVHTTLYEIGNHKKFNIHIIKILKFGSLKCYLWDAKSFVLWITARITRKNSVFRRLTEFELNNLILQIPIFTKLVELSHPALLRTYSGRKNNFKSQTARS